MQTPLPTLETALAALDAHAKAYAQACVNHAQASPDTPEELLAYHAMVDQHFALYTAAQALAALP